MTMGRWAQSKQCGHTCWSPNGEGGASRLTSSRNWNGPQRIIRTDGGLELVPAATEWPLCGGIVNELPRVGVDTPLKVRNVFNGTLHERAKGRKGLPRGWNYGVRLELAPTWAGTDLWQISFHFFFRNETCVRFQGKRMVVRAWQLYGGRTTWVECGMRGSKKPGISYRVS